jgi:hypothetical protein
MLQLIEQSGGTSYRLIKMRSNSTNALFIDTSGYISVDYDNVEDRRQ